MAEIYTRVPRATLWLFRGGQWALGGEGEPVDVAPFYIAKAPITNRQYEAFDPGHGRSPRSPGDDGPVVGVSLEDARAYCTWYAELSGKNFRLPTELEWEYACLWGEKGSALAPEQADRLWWDRENSGGRAQDVEGKEANTGGIHDMLGNVWEWTDAGVMRGGSFRTPRQEMGRSIRRLLDPTLRQDDVGFRILRLLRG